MRTGSVAAAVAVLLGALAGGAARADLDPTYHHVFALEFAPDFQLSFDDLTPTATLVPGDPIAPGVSFGGLAQPETQRALVVDAGGGDLELHTVNLGTPEAPLQSRIVLAFDDGLQAVGAVVVAVPSDFTQQSTRVTIYDAALDTLFFAQFESFFPLNSFFGVEGTAASRPTRFVEYRFVSPSFAQAMPLVLDDLAVLVPEPGGTALGVAAAFALGALRAARLRRTHYDAGLTFWFRWKKFVGSSASFNATSRS